MHRPSRVSPSAAMALIALASLAGCAKAPAAAAPERVAQYTSPMWFEETRRFFQVSPDGRHALYGTGSLARLYDLASGAADSASWRGAFEQVRGGGFLANGALAHLATVGGTPGWFTGEAAAATRLDVPADALPRWSADGSRFAWFRAGDSTLMAGPIGGLVSVALDGRVTGADWGGGSSALFAVVLHDDGLSSLERIGAGDTVITIARHLDASPSLNTIAVAPGGKTAYLPLAGDSMPTPALRHDPDAPHRDLDIYAIHLGDGKVHRMFGAPGDDFAPVIAAGRLFWTHNEPDAAVVVLPIGGGDAHVVAEHGFLPRWSRDGREIAFTRAYHRLSDYGLDMDGWVVAVDSSGVVTRAPAPLIAGYGEDMGPVWSPDGRWIAFHSHRSAAPVPLYDSPGRTDDLWLRLTGGGPELRVTDTGFEVGPPDWAPDGRHLLFDMWERAGPPRVSRPWIVTLDPATGRGHGIARLPLPPQVSSVAGEAWSPVRDEIAIVARTSESGQALWVGGSTGAGWRHLTDFTGYTIGGVAWTPDGATLLYGALANGHMEIFSIPRAGGAAQEVTHSDVNLMHPSVSPDGRLLAATRLPWRKSLMRVALPR